MLKKLKGNTLGGILVTLLIIAIIVIVLIKLGILRFGNGGDGEAVQANADITTVSDEITETETETSVVQEKIQAKITVSGEEYLYQNNSYTLDNLMAEITKNEEIEVHIYLDDTATLAAREALEVRLDEEDIPHDNDILEKDK